MNLLVHISDLHFGREIPTVIDGVLAQLTQLQPDMVIISGDLTQRAKTSEFRRARDFIRRIEAPTFIVPGNHDLSAHNMIERFANPWHKWRRFIAPELEPNMRTNGFIAVGINSARRSGLYLDWSRGRINNQQLNRVIDAFAEEQEQQLRLAVVHHPFWLPPGQEQRELIGERDHAIVKLARAGTDVILSGHVHIAYSQTLEGVIISHAGTTISNRLRPGRHNSFNILRGNRQRMQIQTMEWRNGSFEPAQEHHFKRVDSLWEADLKPNGGANV